jgi:hypothetical protein
MDLEGAPAGSGLAERVLVAVPAKAQGTVQGTQAYDDSTISQVRHCRAWWDLAAGWGSRRFP